MQVRSHTGSISAYALPTPSPSPPWDRGSNLFYHQLPQHHQLPTGSSHHQLHHHPASASTAAASTTNSSPAAPSSYPAGLSAVAIDPSVAPTLAPSPASGQYSPTGALHTPSPSPAAASSSAAAMAQMVPQTQMMILPAPTGNPNAKDSRWLTLEVCREFQRSKCSRSDTECKFAHPPPHVEVQNGRVVACFDSIKGKCQRKDPPCKYLHPPQHLREQLLQNGRNNLILRNLQLQAYNQQLGVMPVSHYPGLTLQGVPSGPASYNPYMAASLPAHTVGLTSNGEVNPLMAQPLQQTVIPATAKAVRADKFETSTENGDALSPHSSLVDTLSYQTYVTQSSPQTLPSHLESLGYSTYLSPQVCREYQRGTCTRPTSECRFAHPAEHIAVDSSDNHVTVCMDFVKSKCTRDQCKYFHPPSHLQALVRALHGRSQTPGVGGMSSSNCCSGSVSSSHSALQSMQGVGVPAYKRIAMGDGGKGGIPVYPSQLMSPYQHTASLMQLQQPQSFIPMSFAGHPPGVPRF